MKKIESISCPSCKKFYVVNWTKKQVNVTRWWYRILYVYWEGKAVGKDGEVYGLTYYTRTRRFLDK